MTDQPIKIWPWEEAPEEYKKHSTSCGDEDWVAFVPNHLGSAYIPWLEEGSSFGRCRIEYFRVEGGQIRIGSHA